MLSIELHRIHELQPPASRTEQVLIEEIKLLLNKRPKTPKKVLIIVDGLDELDKVTDEDLRFLPPSIAPGFHLLVTMRGDPPQDQGKWQKLLGWEDIKVHRFTIGNLQKQDILELSRQVLLPEIEFIPPELVDCLYEKSDGGDPFLVASYLRDFWINLENTSVDRLSFKAKVKHFCAQNYGLGMNGYLRSVIAQLKTDKENLRMFFAALSLARAPLMIDDIYGLGFSIDKEFLTAISSHSRGLIVGDGKKIGFSFSHPRIAVTFQENSEFMSEEEQFIIIQRFLDYGRRTLEQLIHGEMEPQSVSPYILRHYLSHLIGDSRDPSVLAMTEILNPAWINAHDVVLGGLRYLSSDIEKLWVYAYELTQKTSDKKVISDSILTIWKCALYTTSITSLSMRLPPNLPALLVHDEQWSFEQAQYYAFQIPDALQRVRTIFAFLKTEKIYQQLPDHAIQVLCNTIVDSLPFIKLSRASDSSVQQLRYYLLVDLFPYLNWNYEQKTVYNAIQAIPKPLWRIRALSEFATYVPEQSFQLDILAQALQEMVNHGHAGYDELEDYDYALESLAQSLCQTQLLYRVCRIAYRTSTGSSSNPKKKLWGDLLGKLAPFVPNDCADDFLQLCLDFEVLLSTTHSSYLPLPRIIIILAPNISSAMGRKAIDFLLNFTSTSKRRLGYWSSPWHVNDWFALTDNELIAGLLIGHHTSDGFLKQYVQQLITDVIAFSEKEGENSTYYNRKVKELLTGFHAFQELLEGSIDLEIFLEHLENQDIHFTEDDFILLPYFNNSEKLIAHVLQRRGINDIYETGSGHAVSLRESNFLSLYAQSLADEDLGRLFSMIPGFETSGRLRAIVNNIHRMPSYVIQRSITFMLNADFSYQINLNSLNSLKALKLVAPYLTVSHISRYLQRDTWDYWEEWWTFEHIAPYLNQDVVAIAIKQVIESIARNDNVSRLQKAVVLAERLDQQERTAILQQIQQYTNKIGDLPIRFKIVDNMSYHVGWIRGRQLRSQSISQVNALLTTSTLSTAKQYELILLLPFWKRTGGLLKLRHSILENEDNQGKGALLVIVYSIYRIRFVLIVLRIIVYFSFYIFARFPFAINMLNKILADTDGIPMGKLSSWFAKSIYKSLKRDSITDGVRGSAYYKGSNSFQQELLILKNDLTKSATLPDEASYQNSIQKIFNHSYITLAECIRNPKMLHQESLSIFSDISTDIITPALDVLFDELIHLDISEIAGTLISFIPKLALHRPNYLSAIAKFTEQKASYDGEYHAGAIILSYIAKYTSNASQEKYLHSALQMAKRRYENRQWTCGIVLTQASQYVPTSLLPTIATYLKVCRFEKKLDARYEAAMQAFSKRLPEDISLLKDIWPIVEQTGNTAVANAIIAETSPFLDKKWLVRMLLFSLHQPDGLDITSGSALRDRWKELPMAVQLEMFNEVLKGACDLPRPIFLQRITWFWQTFASMGENKKSLANSMASSILEVGEWLP